MKKLMFSILPALLLALVSCMNISQGSEGGSVRVVLPSSSRALYSSGHDDVDSFTVRLLLDEKIINEKSITKETADTGGAIVFDELEPATYTVEVEGRMSSKDVLLYFGTEEAKVTAGQDADCQVKLKKDCQIYDISFDTRELKTACEADGNIYIFMDEDSSISTNQATSENNYQLTNITSGTKIIRGNGGKLEQSTDDNKTLTTEGDKIKLFNVSGSSTILEINNLTFTATSGKTVGTTSALDGALICVDDGATVILKQCLIKDISISNGDTSLIYVKNGGKLLLENCTFYNNTSTLERNSVGYSECIRIDNGAQVEVVSCNFESNGDGNLMSNAAAIENSGSCHITNTTFKGNTANRGSAIMNNDNGILEIEDSTFDSNTCTSNGGYYARRGGAIFIQGGSVKITDSTFTGNKAGGYNPGSEGTEAFKKLGGGAISIKTGSLVLQNTRFDNNSVTSTSKNDAYGYGGAILIEQSDANLFLKDASGAAMDIASYINKYMRGNTVGTGKEGANIYCNGGTINGTVYTKAWE
ncbi:right-handed parallel beta-helix repeat-containing protein [uncultured Treponema sp.]|uniref:right-handed parallel beta-helix repeat-containing protein n=1 Tax=uncultured Treponema sp. TaxID=162155 RepID=UPI002584C114|nr:right-handed parallel beta-helix repeat-containing protein [uncultured Treponema sp.]